MQSINNFLKNRYKILLLILIAFILFFIYVDKYSSRKPQAVNISIGTTTIYAQVAESENKKSLGLSYTENLSENAGMLFIFDDIGVKNFWMRDMYFDLDIIWLDENKQVVGFFENVSKSSYNKLHPELSKIYHSPDTTKYVLEVNAGTIEKLKVKVGDKLDFNY